MNEFVDNPRQSPRARVRCSARIVAGGSSLEGETEDVGATGCLVVAPAPLRSPSPLEVHLAVRPVSRFDPRLFHKTTDRAPYDEARRARPEGFDVLLWNEEGEATEFTIGNLVAELDGERVTPPREAGLLGGVFRAALLVRGEVVERTVPVAALARAGRLWLVNALRGWVPVVLRPGERA